MDFVGPSNLRIHLSSAVSAIPRSRGFSGLQIWFLT